MSATDMNDATKPTKSPLIFNALAFALLVLVTISAASSGLSSLFTTYAAQTNQLADANTAVRLSSNNPDARYVRATILQASDLPAAIKDYYQAALARPEDYVLWLSLARVYELNGDVPAAIAAAQQAIPLAPDYAEPHYQLGNILLRAGRQEEAFKELRIAAASNPTLLPGVIDLAWTISAGNVSSVLRQIDPQTPESRHELAQYFRAHQQVDAAIALYSALGPVEAPYRTSYVADLIGAKQFKDAAKVWAVGRTGTVGTGVVNDAGFEQESDLKEPGFGWRIGDRAEGFQLSLDANNPKEGRSSLKVEFKGASDPGALIIGQFVLVEPQAHYSLKFAARSAELVSGGAPMLFILDAATGQILAASEPIRAKGNWEDYKIDFQVPASTDAIQIVLRRSCDVSPCPIFGRVWLDDFSLQKL
ncbi:MAG TPA: tetratricopeptide repeat protein [Pyrinomonadaceae bacterium]|jgi:Tfp pilus assembly protein PilF